MLAGEPPFTGADGAGAHREAAQRAGARMCRQARPSVPEHVEQAVSKALAPVAADRFPSAAEFARALQVARPAAQRLEPPPADSSGGRAKAAARLPVGGDRAGPRDPHWARRAVRLAAEPSRGRRRTGAKVLAVLPFENLGDSADAYFADGVANDVRTKLSQIAGLAVIARGSSNEYRQTTKTPAADRPRAGRRLPAHRHRPVGQGRRTARAGSG